MKSRKDFKKKNANYRKNQEDEIRIKERRKQPKKINKRNYYAMLEDDDDDLDINLFDYEEEEEEHEDEEDDLD